MPLPVDIPSIDVLFHTQWHPTSKTIRLWASIQAVTTRSPSEYTPTFSVLLECTSVQTTVASGRATTAQSPTITGCVLHCTTGKHTSHVLRKLYKDERQGHSRMCRQNLSGCVLRCSAQVSCTPRIQMPSCRRSPRV